ncbi:MAG: DUF1707 SHOCT-like domain-containing protein [Streptosporangiaceae bacterium]
MGGVIVGDADRDRAVEVLRELYARGTLDDADLDRRTQIALTARSTNDLQLALADLPSLAPAAAPAASRRPRGRSRGQSAPPGSARPGRPAGRRVAADR